MSLDPETQRLIRELAVVPVEPSLRTGSLLSADQPAKKRSFANRSSAFWHGMCYFFRGNIPRVGPAMHLHPDTQRLMREFFGPQKCCKCGAPATRYTRN